MTLLQPSETPHRQCNPTQNTTFDVETAKGALEFMWDPQGPPVSKLVITKKNKSMTLQTPHVLM